MARDRKIGMCDAIYQKTLRSGFFYTSLACICVVSENLRNENGSKREVKQRANLSVFAEDEQKRKNERERERDGERGNLYREKKK